MQYIKPEMEVIQFTKNDVVRTSFEGTDAPPGEW